MTMTIESITNSRIGPRSLVIGHWSSIHIDRVEAELGAAKKKMKTGPGVEATTPLAATGKEKEKEKDKDNDEDKEERELASALSNLATIASPSYVETLPPFIRAMAKELRDDVVQELNWVDPEANPIVTHIWKTHAARAQSIAEAHKYWTQTHTQAQEDRGQDKDKDKDPSLDPVEFCSLITRGDIKEVRRVVSTGLVNIDQVALVNKFVGEVTTPLIASFASGHPEISALLIENGADVNKMNGRTSPLISAVVAYGTHTSAGHTSAGHTSAEKRAALFSAIRMLLERNADVHAKDHIGRTALACVNFENSTKVAELLLDFGADVNTRDHRGRTILMHQVISYMEKVVRASDARTSLDAFSKFEKVAERLERFTPDINAKDNAGETALMHACAAPTFGNDHVRQTMPLLKWLIKKGAQIHHENDTGRTAFETFEAAYSRKTGIGHFLSELLACARDSPFVSHAAFALVVSRLTRLD